MATKILGYALALLGLAVIVLSNKISSTIMKGFGSKSMVYTILGAIVLLIAGIAFVMMDTASSKKVKHASEEVPIYEGEGKKRRIVGYKKTG
jgi:hypothetical protein